MGVFAVARTSCHRARGGVRPVQVTSVSQVQQEKTIHVVDLSEKTVIPGLSRCHFNDVVLRVRVTVIQHTTCHVCSDVQCLFPFRNKSCQASGVSKVLRFILGVILSTALLSQFTTSRNICGHFLLSVGVYVRAAGFQRPFKPCVLHYQWREKSRQSYLWCFLVLVLTYLDVALLNVLSQRHCVECCWIKRGLSVVPAAGGRFTW